MGLHIEGFIWLDWVVDKIIAKHGVYPDEVEEVFFGSAYKIRRVEAGKFQLFGRSGNGRYLLVIFSWQSNFVRVISARDMTSNERRFYGRK